MYKTLPLSVAKIDFNIVRDCSYRFNLQGGLPDFRLPQKLIWPSNGSLDLTHKCPDPSISSTRFNPKKYDKGPCRYQSHSGEGGRF